MKCCLKDDLRLTGCVDFIRHIGQPFWLFWDIPEYNIAPEFTLTLFKRNRAVSKTYVITPDVNGVIVWQPDVEDFSNSIMYYELRPTVAVAETFIIFHGKIITK